MEDLCFYGRNGALTPTGDLILETRALAGAAVRGALRGDAGGTLGIGSVVRAVFPGGRAGCSAAASWR